MPSLNFKRRIWQVVGLITLSLFVSQLLQWDQGLWVAVSVTAIIGPFSASLTIEKSRNRILGTIAGLLIATVLEIFLRYNYQTVFIVGILLAYILGFTVQQNYRYFIMVVTIAICLNFEYMNLPFTSFEPISFLVSRFMGVLTGISLFLFVQKFVYGERNARMELAESTLLVERNISKSLLKITGPDTLDPTTGIDLAMDLSASSEPFRELFEASSYGVSQTSVEYKRANQIRKLERGVVSLLLSYATLDMQPTETSRALKANIQKRASKINNILMSSKSFAT